MPQNSFFVWTRDLLVRQKTTQRHFFSTLHPLSTVIFATATVLAFVLLHDSRFSFHCYAQREEPLATSCAKDYKALHSSKPASLNRPIPNSEPGIAELFCPPLPNSELGTAEQFCLPVPDLESGTAQQFCPLLSSCRRSFCPFKINRSK